MHFAGYRACPKQTLVNGNTPSFRLTYHPDVQHVGYVPIYSQCVYCNKVPKQVLSGCQVTHVNLSVDILFVVT